MVIPTIGEPSLIFEEHVVNSDRLTFKIVDIAAWSR